MSKFQYKTNIKCGGCIAKVTPFLDQAAGVKKWEVDTDNPNKILSVELEGMDSNTLIQLVQEAGFKAEVIES
jgi:copper chaperone